MGIIRGYFVPSTVTRTRWERLGAGEPYTSGIVRHIVPAITTPNASDYIEFLSGETGAVQTHEFHVPGFAGGRAAAVLGIPFRDGVSVRGELHNDTEVIVVIEWDYPAPVQ